MRLLGCSTHLPSCHINLNGHKPAEVGDMHIQVDWDRSFISLHELGCFAAPYLSLRFEPWLVVHQVTGVKIFFQRYGIQYSRVFKNTGLMSKP